MLNNKTALITGASRGIGKACAIALDSAGFSLVINYNKSKDEAQTLAKSLNNAIAIQADVADSAQVSRMMEQAYAKFGEISVLVNNAGIARQSLFTDVTEFEWDNMFAVNMKSMFLVTKAILPKMIHNRYGKIINISSMWGEVGGSCEVLYSATKSAIIGFTKALAKEVGPSNINVNCISPGVIKTDMIAGLDKAALAELAQEAALCRLGEPIDIAKAVCFLASDDSSFITGQILGVNGGIVI